MLNELGKKQCANFKKGKCVSSVNPQPLDNFTLFSSQIGHRQRCNSCLEFYKKKYPCINSKNGICFSSINPQPLGNFILGTTELTKSKLCKSCAAENKKYCSNSKIGSCVSKINPQDLSEFMDKRGKEHAQTQCRSCLNGYYGKNRVRIRQVRRIWEKENDIPAIRRDRLHRLKTGQYDQVFVKQLGHCAICGIPQSQVEASLVVDHNHSNDNIRGLLCDKCNWAIGLLGDNPSILRTAADYVDLDGRDLDCILGDRQVRNNGK